MSRSSYTTLEKYNTTYEYFTKNSRINNNFSTRESYNSNIQQKFSKYAGKKEYVIFCSANSIFIAYIYYSSNPSS